MKMIEMLFLKIFGLLNYYDLGHWHLLLLENPVQIKAAWSLMLCKEAVRGCPIATEPASHALWGGGRVVL